MPTLGIVVASARPHRVGQHVAQWVHEQVPASWDVEIIDLAEQPLPFFDGESSPKQGLPRTDQHAIDWAARIDGVDALVITTPEYNGSFPAILKNALDYLYAEVSGLPVALVGYGWAAGAGAMEATQSVLQRLDAQVVGSVGLGFRTDLEPDGTLHVTDETASSLRSLLDALGDTTAARADAS